MKRIIERTMKVLNVNNSFTLLAVLVVLTSCSDWKEREHLSEKAEQLEQQLHERDSAFNEMLNVMNTVEQQINQIKEKSNIISLNREQTLSDDDKSQLVDDLVSIDRLIEQSNQAIQSLSTRLNNSDMALQSVKLKMKGLSETLEKQRTNMKEMKKELEEKDLFIADLNNKVGSLEFRIGLQKETIELQLDKINEQQDKLNIAYVAIGSEQHLRNEGIVTKEGGFLWIGRTTELQEDASREHFVEVDIKDIDKLLIDSKSARLITEHPSDSYELVKQDGNVAYLSIKDPDRFWNISKYLVITTKG